MLTIEYNGKQYKNFQEQQLIDAGVPESVIAKAKTDAVRRVAYKAESDPLVMEYHRKLAASPGTYTAEEIEAARLAIEDKDAEIKARYPLPE